MPDYPHKYDLTSTAQMVQRVATIVIAAALIWMGTQMQNVTNRLTSIESTLIASTKIITLERKVDMADLESRLSILKERSEAMGEEVIYLKDHIKRMESGIPDKNIAE